MRQSSSLAIVFTLPLLSLLACCVAPPEGAPAPRAEKSRSKASKPKRPRAAAPAPSPTPAPAPTPVTPAQAAPEWHDRPATPGTWTYRTEVGGSAALFGVAPAQAQLALRCDKATRRISLTRVGATGGAMTVRTSYGATVWPATATGAQSGIAAGLTAMRAANDSTLDQIAYSRGRFAVEVAGLPTLTVPSWAEVARVIEDCRA